MSKDLTTVWAGGGNSVGGYTDWPSGDTAPNFDFNTTASGTDFVSKPTLTASAFEGTSGSFYIGSGKYKTGAQEGGKDVYWNFSASISSVIRTGEQEHCDDFAEAYRISLKEAEGVLKSKVVGNSFGPKAAKADAEALVLDTIKSNLTHAQLGNDKTQWSSKYHTLYNKTLTRDTSGWHSISLGARSVDGSGNVVYEVVKGTSRIPGPKSSTIITY